MVVGGAGTVVGPVGIAVGLIVVVIAGVARPIGVGIGLPRVEGLRAVVCLIDHAIAIAVHGVDDLDGDGGRFGIAIAVRGCEGDRVVAWREVVQGQVAVNPQCPIQVGLPRECFYLQFAIFPIERLSLEMDHIVQEVGGPVFRRCNENLGWLGGHSEGRVALVAG